MANPWLTVPTLGGPSKAARKKSVAALGLTPAEAAAIRARNLAHPVAPLGAQAQPANPALAAKLRAITPAQEATEQFRVGADQAATAVTTQPGVSRDPAWLKRAVEGSAFFVPGVGTALGAGLLLHDQGLPHSPGSAAWDLSMLPFLRGPRAALRAVKAIHSGESATEAVSAARASLHEPGPITKAVKKVPTRSFGVGNYEAKIPAARSRAGRVIENAVDAIRPVTSELGIAKSETEKAGQEAGRSVRFKQSLQEVPTLMLRKVAKKLDDTQEYALRVVAEGAMPETRVAHHIEQAAAGTKESALYHAEHASMNAKVEKYVEQGPDGNAVLRADAPKALHEAWHWFQQSGELRETLLREIGRLSDAQIAARTIAPARVLHGARYHQFEDIVKQALEGSAPREDLFKAVDGLIRNPVRAEAVKTAIDGLARSAAERAGTPLESGNLFSRIEDVKLGGTPPADALHQSYNLEAAAIALKMIQAQRGDVEPLIGQIAERFGVDEQALREALNSEEVQRTFDRIHSNQEVWKENRPDLGEPTAKNVRKSVADPTQWGEKNTLEQRGSVYNHPLEGQVGGSIDEASKYGIKGAIEFTPRSTAIIHLTTAADETTFIHELAHLVRRYATTGVEQKRIAKAMGAKLTNGPEMKAARKAGQKIQPEYHWDTASEEKFARAVEEYVRRGNGPYPIKQAFKTLAPAFRDVYEHIDLPDVPQHVAKFLDKLFGYERHTGGALIGAEDITLGVEYAPAWRGMPLNKLTQPHMAMAAYLRRTSGALFGAGRKAAIGGGPEDAALAHDFEGSLLLGGHFTKDVVGPKIQSAVIASRMSAAHLARRILVDAGEKLPSAVDAIAVKVDPSINAGDDLKVLWDKMASIERTGTKLSDADLNGVNFDLVERMRNSVFGFTGSAEARQASEWLAQKAMELQEPVENIVWVPREFVEQTGLLHVPGAARLAQRGLSKKQIRAYKALGISVDALNDFVKATILYLNPAYIPVQFVGNMAMALMQQGAFMPRNLARLSLLHQELEPIHRVAADHLMQHGIFSSTPMFTGPGEFIKQTFGSMANRMADWLPRRLAFIHEAYRSGYGKGKLGPLIDAALKGDDNALHELQMIADRGNDAMVDFDRMSPLERESFNRWIFFYPWLRGATRYSSRFAADHPVQAVAIAMAVDHMLAASYSLLGGERPYQQQLDVPVSTQSVGLSVPGTDIGVGLDQLIGKHTWMDGNHPMVESLRQLLTFTTPADLIQSGIAFAGGPNKEAAAGLAQNLSPVPYALGVSLFGYDPFTHQQVTPGLGTFLSQISPENQSPLWSKLKLYNMSPSERASYEKNAIHPRSRKEELWSIGGGSVAPAPYNVEVSQERVLASKPLLERRTKQLELDSKKAGLGQPPQDVLDDLQWKTRLDHSIKNGQSYFDRAKIAAALFDERYGTHESDKIKKGVTTEGQAQAYYEALRPQLYPVYQQWDGQVQHILAAEAEAQPVTG